MRRYLIGGLIALILVLVAIPASLGRLSASGNTFEHALSPSGISSDTWPIKVYFPGSKTVQTMPLGEYLKGVVAAEMEPDFETEALKAQMIVARTYALRRMFPAGEQSKGGCPDDPAADICADPKTGQAYTSKHELAGKMGAGAANVLWQRLDKIQAETDGRVLRWKGQLIDPLYHSVSGTKTEDAGSYYSQSLPYLKSVDDHWGQDSPRLKKIYEFTPAELAEKLSTEGKPLAVPALANSVTAGKAPVLITAYTESGRVKTVRVDAVIFSGREFREKLDLQSTNFAVSVQKGQIVVTTTGYGHGVGMSQWGANGMARAGKTYADILKHYYTGVEVAWALED
ncbi:MAG TPA: stage II sporulation protein D [Symbiobacteriaceae bacterium]|nr:stage II sporulation protein D [Symbiobacteriaceae bacterium]